MAIATRPARRAVHNSRAVHIEQRRRPRPDAIQQAAGVLLPEPADLLATALRIAAHADAVRLEADRLDAAVRRMTWRGAAATVFDALAADLTAGLRATADRLDSAAAAMRRHAHAVQDTLDTLRRVAGDGISLTHAVAQGLLDGVADPRALLGDTADALGAAGHTVADVGHLIGIG